MKNLAASLVLSTLLSSCVYAQERTDQPEIILSEANVENAYPRLSKDGRTILYQSNRSGKWQLYILDIATRKSTQLTTGNSNNNFPDWDAENKRVAFVSDRDGNEELYMMNVDGTGQQRLTSSPERDIHPYFSPDGRSLLFNSTRGNGSLDIYLLTFADSKTARITDTRENETCARYSPDMKNIVFLRNDEAGDDLFVMDLTKGTSDNVTNDPAIRDGWPVYSADGGWVYYSSMQNGPYNIFRLRPGGTGKQQVTKASANEEDARASISRDGKKLVYNKRKSDRIEILAIAVKSS